MKRGRPKLPLKKRVLRHLSRNRRYCSLQEMYRAIPTVKKDPGQRAALRGVLNHDIADGRGLFKRHPRKPGWYKITNIGILETL